jgi:membrane-associated phospholipid phosphatase
VGLPSTQVRTPVAHPPASTEVSLRAVAFGVLSVAYGLLTLGVLVDPSPVLSADQWWLNQHMWGNHPQYHYVIYHYVILGQRAPATLAFLPVFIFVAWRERTSRPLVMLATSLLLLNVSVGVVKYAIGRIGPRDQSDVYQVFAGGNIFPSGHLSNVVVLYGLLAWVVPRFRKWIIAATAFFCVTVGLGTIYLRTHWFSDVIGGWIAGALVLLALPSVMPYAQRWTDRTVAAVEARLARRRGEVRVTWAARRVDRESVGSGGRSGQGNATPVG